MLNDAMEQFKPSQSKELPNDRMDQEDENSYTAITFSDTRMTQESTCCMQNERIILELQKLLRTNHIQKNLIEDLKSSITATSYKRNASLENMFICSVLDIIRMALFSQKWYEEKLGIFNCQLCKYVSKESAEFFEHVANKDHLEKMTLGKSLFEKKLLIFSLLDDLDLCKVEITSLDLTSFSDAVSGKIVKRNILKALHLAILAIRSEEEKIDSYAKEQLLQNKTNLENDVRRVAQQVSADESCFSELLAILNEYHWHQQEESGSFRCLLCGTNLLKFHNFILHVSSKLHLDKVCDGKTAIVKKQIVLGILLAVNDCAFRVKNFDLQNATSFDLIAFKRRVEINLNKAKEVIKGNLEGNTIEQESGLILLESRSSEILRKGGNSMKVQEEVIGEGRNQNVSADRNLAFTEKASSTSSMDKKELLARDHIQASQIDSHINDGEQAVERQSMKIAVTNNLWPDETLYCCLCSAELNSFVTKLEHFLGRKHLAKLLDGNSIPEEQVILRELYDKISNCEQDFKAINIYDCDRVEEYIKCLVKAKCKLVTKICPRLQPMLDSTSTATVILLCLRDCGKFECSLKNLFCWTCYMQFSPSYIYNFIPHIVGATHITNFCDGKDISVKKNALSKMYRQLIECETQVRILLIEDESLKNKILLDLDEAIKTLESNYIQDECKGGSAEKNLNGFDEENVSFLSRYFVDEKQRKENPITEISENLSAGVEKNQHQFVHDKCQTNKEFDAIDKQVLEIMVNRNLWHDKSGKSGCGLCKLELYDVGSMLTHSTGTKHMQNLLLVKQENEVYNNDMYSNISCCYADLKESNIQNHDKVKGYLKILYLSRNRLLANSLSKDKSGVEERNKNDGGVVIKIVLQCLKVCGSFKYISGEFRCLVCKSFSSTSVHNFIMHIVGSRHIQSMCMEMDIHAKQKIVRELYRQVVQCQIKLGELDIPMSMKGHILLALSDAMVTLEVREMCSPSDAELAPETHMNTSNASKLSIEVNSQNEKDNIVCKEDVNNPPSFINDQNCFSLVGSKMADSDNSEVLENGDGVKKKKRKKKQQNTEKIEMGEPSAGVDNSAHTSDFPIGKNFCLTCKDCGSEFIIYNCDVQLSYDIHAQSDNHQLAVMKPLERSIQEAAQEPVVKAKVSLKPIPIDMVDDVVLEILVKQKLLPKKSEDFCLVCKVAVSNSVGTRLMHCLGNNHFKNLLAGKCASEKEQTCIEFHNIISHCEAELQNIKTKGCTKIAFYLNMLSTSKSSLSKKIEKFVDDVNMECPVKQSGLKHNESNIDNNLDKIVVECLKVFGSVPCNTGKFNCVSCTDVTTTGPQDFIAHVVGSRHIKQICDGLDRNGTVEAMHSLQNKLRDFVLKLLDSNCDNGSLKKRLLCALNKAEKHVESLLTSSENAVNAHVKAKIFNEACRTGDDVTLVKSQNCTIGNVKVAINKKGKLIDSVDSESNTDETNDQELLVSLKSLIQCPIAHFYSNVKPDNSYFCESCDVELSFPCICPGLSILKHIVSFEHMSVAQSEETLSLKIEHIEEILNTIENLKPNVVAYIKRSNFAGICEVVRKVKKEITFVKTFETDFWDFVSKLKNVPVCNYVSDRDTLKVVQIISHPSCIDQYVGLEDIQFMHFNLAILHERLSGFSMPVFRKEIEEAVFHLSIGGQRVVKKLRELSD